MTIHQVKCWPEYFGPIKNGTKTFDLRKDDRPGGYQPGDVLQFEEYMPGLNRHTGQVTQKRVVCVLKNFEGMLPGYIILGLSAT
jgi:Domain of unknown function (DUF3850)